MCISMYYQSKAAQRPLAAPQRPLCFTADVSYFLFNGFYFVIWVPKFSMSLPITLGVNVDNPTKLFHIMCHEQA